MYEEIELKRDFWNPSEEGEKIEGVVVGIEEGNYGKQYLIDRKLEDKEIIKTPSHKVLQLLMQEIKLQDRIRITYKGFKPPSIKGNNPTEIYKLELWKEGKADDPC